MKSLDDVLGHTPLPEPDPPERAERAVERYVQEVEREELESIVDAPPATTARTARQHLAAAVDEDAEQLVGHALSEAKRAKGRDAVSAVTALIDASESKPRVRIPATPEEVEALSFVELTRAVAVIRPEALSESSRRLIEQ